MNEKSNRTNGQIAMGFEKAAQAVDMSKTFLRTAAADNDPKRRLKTVRVNRRRLITPEDLADWFSRVSREDRAAK